jgi:hypothetical protein
VSPQYLQSLPCRNCRETAWSRYSIEPRSGGCTTVYDWEVSTRPRYEPFGHTRLSRYARVKVGIITRDQGVYSSPDTNPRFQGKKRQHVSRFVLLRVSVGV